MVSAPANGVNGVNGANGANGANGVNGVNGANGANGANGVNGVNGANGVDGVNGANGVNGVNGANGINGVNGVNGATHASSRVPQSLDEIPLHERSYLKILNTLFSSRLDVVNAPNGFKGSTAPSHALGQVLQRTASQHDLAKTIRSFLSDPSERAAYPELATRLSEWIDASPSESLVNQIRGQLQTAKASASPSSLVAKISAFSPHFLRKSLWIIGSDAWSYDFGSSGLHHVLSSGSDVNLLLIDEALPGTPGPRKKDAGLYAMNYGNAYVASVAVFGNYSHVLQAFREADAFKGPSVILAYLPKGDQDEQPALDVLKETKTAVDSGYWPLYRWNPANESKGPEEVFHLDSEKIKAELNEFLDRDNHLTLLSRREPQFDDHLAGSGGKKLSDFLNAQARAAFDRLQGSFDGPPLLILYASDGGQAAKFAKRLTQRAQARSVGARVIVMDDFSLDDLALETNVAFVTSTAGQGEFPQNGRRFWKALMAQQIALSPDGGDGKSLANVNYTVFGLGDTHYWPRPEDARYYNKPGKDLDARLVELGANRLIDIGLGNDQDPDGPTTGYKEWESRLWKALGVGDIEVIEAEAEPITNENIKLASNYLRGTIAEGLADTSTGSLAESDGQITKFHGIYQQDDRDIRDQRKDQGLEPAYGFMVRLRLPGGVCTPQQWLSIDGISNERGNQTFKLTTRQTFQFHGVIKRNLKPAIQAINRALLDTIAACGDVNRNVMCSTNPSLGKLHAEVHQTAKKLSEHMKPHSSAYAEIWLDKKLVAGEAVRDVEPLYGPYYLPRKFKIAIAVPPENDVDVFANDLGFIAIVDTSTRDLVGFNVSIGGGMGVTHANKKTYPRAGTVVGFIYPDQIYDVAEKIITTQRDHGNRADRKNARLKYTIDRMGIENFVAEVESRLGWKLEAARPYEFTSNIDKFGWHTSEDGKTCSFVAFVENGRIQDEPGKPFKTCLREIAKIHKGVFRLTPNQHIIVSDIPVEEKDKIHTLLKQHHLDTTDFSGLRLSSSACVAFPTCGLAMAESERYLPILIDKVEKICEENGLRNDSIVMRMTGCPNGCARPYLAELAFVGKAPGTYLMLLGGGFYGQRLNKIYRESVTEPEILAILGPMIKRYATERLEGEKFGDWTVRAGIISETKSGMTWYENMAPGQDQIQDA